MKNALIYLLVFAAIQIGCASGVQLLWPKMTGSPDITPMMLVAMSALGSVVAGVVFVLARWSAMSRGYIRSRQWAVLLWAGVAAAGAIIPSAWLQEQLPELPNWVEGQFDMILRDRWGYVAVGLLAPLVEEMVFRGAILRSLLSTMSRPWAAVVVSAVMFALFHANPAQMPHALLVGLLLGWMYMRTGSIVPGVAYHWVNNTIAYVMYNVMPNPDAPLSELFGGNTQRVLMAVGFSLLILLPALLQLNMGMKKSL